MKKWIAALLALMLLLQAGSLAEGAVAWRYSFVPGDALSGEGMDKVEDFMNAVQIQLTTETREDASLGEATLISYDKPVFVLRASTNVEDSFGLYCSLMGDCTLLCRQDQVEDFLMTLVQMMADRSILQQDSVAQAQSLARRAAAMITQATNGQTSADPAVFMDLNFYLSQLSLLSSEAYTEVLDPTNDECPGAVVKHIWNLTEEDLNILVNSGIQKLNRIPVVSDAFQDGRIMIGSQTIDEDFLRSLVEAMHGTTTLVVYLDTTGETIRMSLYTPDLSQVVTDPAFENVAGIEFNLDREESEDGTLTSTTALRLIGTGGSLLTVRMEKRNVDSIQDLPTKKVYQVGNMNSDELWQLIQSLWLTIAANAINLILDLPRIVFDTLIDRIF